MIPVVVLAGMPAIGSACHDPGVTISTLVATSTSVTSTRRSLVQAKLSRLVCASGVKTTSQFTRSREEVVILGGQQRTGRIGRPRLGSSRFAAESTTTPGGRTPQRRWARRSGSSPCRESRTRSRLKKSVERDARRRSKPGVGSYPDADADVGDDAENNVSASASGCPRCHRLTIARIARLRQRVRAEVRADQDGVRRFPGALVFASGRVNPSTTNCFVVMSNSRNHRGIRSAAGQADERQLEARARSPPAPAHTQFSPSASARASTSMEHVPGGRLACGSRPGWCAARGRAGCRRPARSCRGSRHAAGRTGCGHPCRGSRVPACASARTRSPPSSASVGSLCAVTQPRAASPPTSSSHTIGGRFASSRAMGPL